MQRARDLSTVTALLVHTTLCSINLLVRLLQQLVFLFQTSAQNLRRTASNNTSGLGFKQHKWSRVQTTQVVATRHALYLQRLPLLHDVLHRTRHVAKLLRVGCCCC